MEFTSAVAHKSNNNVAFYPLCNQVVLEALPPISLPHDPPPKLLIKCLIQLPSGSTSHKSCCIMISKSLNCLIKRMSKASIHTGSSHQFTVADSGATDHIFPNKSAFISYKLMVNLQVRMGNNSYLPVLGQGSAVISLNGQCILVRNALHVLGLVVPLYSLCAHFT